MSIVVVDDLRDRLRRAFARVSLAAALAVTSIFLGGCKKPRVADGPLICHVGGTMQPVIKELARIYEAEGGRKIEINTAGSGELLAHIELLRRGDLYVSHDPFLQILMRRGLGVDGWTVARLVPVIVVSKGNKLKIRNLYDATAPGVSLVLTDATKSMLGHMLPTIFRKAGIDLDAVLKRPNVRTFRKGGQAANVVKGGSADAGIVWNAVAHLRRDALDIIQLAPEHLPVPGVDTVTGASGHPHSLMPVGVTVATLTCSTQPQRAKSFAEFVASERASKIFAAYGFSPASGRGQ